MSFPPVYTVALKARVVLDGIVQFLELSFGKY